MKGNGRLGLGIGLTGASGGLQTAPLPTSTPISLGAAFHWDGDNLGTVGAGQATWVDQVAGLSLVPTVGDPLVASWQGQRAATIAASSNFTETSDNLVVAGSAYTLLLWAQSDDATGGCVFCLRKGTKYRAHHVFTTGGITYVSGDGVGGGQNTTVDDGGFKVYPFFLAWVFRGAGVAPLLYLNGAPVAITAGVQGTEDGTTGAVMGIAGAAGTQFTGKVGGLSILPMQLTTVQIEDLYRGYTTSRYGF